VNVSTQFSSASKTTIASLLCAATKIRPRGPITIPRGPSEVGVGEVPGDCARTVEDDDLVALVVADVEVAGVGRWE